MVVRIIAMQCRLQWRISYSSNAISQIGMRRNRPKPIAIDLQRIKRSDLTSLYLSTNVCSIKRATSLKCNLQGGP